MYYNQPIYEEFDSDDNKKVFYKMYEEEFNRLNQNKNISIIQENEFIEEIKKSKTGDYYGYRNFDNYGNFSYNLKFKYINLEEICIFKFYPEAKAPGNGLF